MEFNLTCSVCLSLFKDPHILPCSHNLCRKCAIVLLKPVTENIQDDPSDNAISLPPDSTFKESMSEAITQMSGWLTNHIKFKEHTPKSAKFTITCPNCRATVDVGNQGVDQFAKNLTLSNIIDTYNNKHNIFDTMTDSEDEEHASAGKRNVSTLSTIQYLCTIHEGKKMNMFCSTCNELVCSSCGLFGTHKGHEIDQLRTALRIGKKFLEDELSKMDEKQLKLLENKDVIISYKCALMGEQTNHSEVIRRNTVSMIRDIQTKETEMVKVLETDIHKKLNILEKEESDTLGYIEIVQNLQSEIMAVLNINNPSDFLKIYKTMVNKSRDFTVSTQFKMESGLKQISGALPDFDAITKMLHATLQIKEQSSKPPSQKKKDLKFDEKHSVVPGHISKCCYMEPFYVMESLLDVVIGCNGAIINAARLVEGITSIKLEIDEMCFFQIFGDSQDACDKARDILQQAIIHHLSNE